MKKDIHPTYYPNATITCACGHVYTIGATRESMEVEICSHCHPFYTGKEKLVDTAGRVEKFQAKMKKSSTAKATHTVAKKKIARREKKQAAHTAKINKQTVHLTTRAKPSHGK